MMKSATNAKMKRNSFFYGLHKTFEAGKSFLLHLLHLCFDILNGTELKVSLNTTFTGNPIGHSVTTEFTKVS